MCTKLYIWIHSSFSMNATTGLSAILMAKVLFFTQKKDIPYLEKTVKKNMNI